MLGEGTDIYEKQDNDMSAVGINDNHFAEVHGMVRRDSING